MNEAIKSIEKKIESVEKEMVWQQERAKMIRENGFTYDQPEHYENGFKQNEFYLLGLRVALAEIKKAL